MLCSVTTTMLKTIEGEDSRDDNFEDEGHWLGPTRVVKMQVDSFEAGSFSMYLT